MTPYIKKVMEFDRMDLYASEVYTVYVPEKNFIQKLLGMKPSYKPAMGYDVDGKIIRKFYSRKKAEIWVEEYKKFHNLSTTVCYYVPMSPTEIVKWKKTCE